ncbi:MAG: hypothetical protein IJQ07_02025 [Clostridia bacterium]|nr:hypothetical protein [Clostridia bacterium]
MQKYICPKISIFDCLKDVLLASDMTMDNIGNLSDWFFDEDSYAFITP